MSTSSKKAWWAAYTDTLPPGYLRFIKTEAEASSIWCFQPAVVPGLLQTERYARSVVRQFRDVLLSEAEMGQRVEVRLKRQWEVLENLPQLHAIIEESVLWRIVGSPEIQHEQLLHLHRLSGQPNITVQILPLSSGIVWEIFGHHPLDLFGFEPPRKPALFVDGLHDHIQRNSEFEVTHYRTTFQKMSERALPPEQSAHLILAVAGQVMATRTSMA